MSPLYKQPVVVFGLVVPLLILFLLLGVVSHYRSGLADTYRNRKVQYVGQKKERVALERWVEEQRPQMERWMALVDRPPARTASDLLKGIQERCEVQVSFCVSRSPGGIRSVSSQPSKGFCFSLRGTYRDLQNALLELETSMPQLQLDGFKLKQDSNRNLLIAHVKYTAWQREKD